MNHARTRLGTVSRRTFEAGSLIILIALLALPFTKAFADDHRRGGPGFYGAVSVQGWRLGGGYRGGGYEIYRWSRGGWIRVPGRGVQLGGNPRSPWVINSQGERYQWTGRDWRFVGYASGRGFNRPLPPPVFRDHRDRDRWYDNRGNHRAPVVQQQRKRIERQQDRIQDLRRDLLRERSDNRQYERREERRDEGRERAREDRQGDPNRREGRNDNGGRRDRDGDRR